MEPEHNNKKISFKEWIKEYAGGLSLLFALIALGVGCYNTLQIESMVLVKAAANNGGSAQVAQETNLLKILNELPVNTPMLGNPKSKLTMIEFADFQCPFCGKFQKETFPALKKEYIDTGKVRFIYMDFAFLGQESIDAAEAARCANDQGQFWQYHDELFANQDGENRGAFSKSKLEQFATNIGLDLPRFRDCVSQNKFDKQISVSKAIGQKYGITGTPGFLIGKDTIKGADDISSFEQTIDKNL